MVYFFLFAFIYSMVHIIFHCIGYTFAFRVDYFLACSYSSTSTLRTDQLTRVTLPLLEIRFERDRFCISSHTYFHFQSNQFIEKLSFERDSNRCPPSPHRREKYSRLSPIDHEDHLTLTFICIFLTFFGLKAWCVIKHYENKAC